MMRIPYPVPMPYRAALIAAGKEAVRHPLDTPEREAASAVVRKIMADIALKYGVDEPDSEE